MNDDGSMLVARVERDWLLIVVGAVVLFRLGVGMLLQLAAVAGHSGGLSPFSFGGDDGAYYQKTALQIADGFGTRSVNPFPSAIGFLMNVFGVRSLYPFKWIGVLCSLGAAFALGGFVRSEPTRRLNGRHVSVLALGLSPSLAFYSTNSLTRDVWIILGFLGASLSFASIVRSRALQPLTLVFGFLCFILVSMLRPYAGIAILMGASAWIVLGNFRGLSRLVVVVVGLGALAVLHARILAQLNTLATLRDTTYSIGGSSVGISLSSGSPLSRAVGYLYSFLFNLAGPLPWQIRSPVLVVSFLFDSLPVIAAVYVIARRRSTLEPWARGLLMIAFSYLALVAIFNDNLGAAGRLRLPATSLLVLIACATYYRRGVHNPTPSTPKALRLVAAAGSPIDLSWRNR